MERKTTETIFSFIGDNILELTPNPAFNGESTIEEAKKNLVILKGFFFKDTLPKGLVSTMPPKYIKKEILSYYNEHLNTDHIVVYSALIAKSFATKFVLGIVLKVTERFNKGDSQTTTKVFNERQKALDWVQESLAAQKQ
jgi:hypothetical protein